MSNAVGMAPCPTTSQPSVARFSHSLELRVRRPSEHRPVLHRVAFRAVPGTLPEAMAGSFVGAAGRCRPRRSHSARTTRVPRRATPTSAPVGCVVVVDEPWRVQRPGLPLQRVERPERKRPRGSRAAAGHAKGCACAAWQPATGRRRRRAAPRAAGGLRPSAEARQAVRTASGAVACNTAACGVPRLGLPSRAGGGAGVGMLMRAESLISGCMES